MPELTRRTLGALLLAAGCPAGARADDAGGLPAPKGKPILTISGRIGRPNVGDAALLDRPTLEHVAWSGFDTTTPWYTGSVRFDGVPLTELMRVVGATGTTLRAIALNDYTTDIPITDFAQFGTLLAVKRNGDYMPVRDKGPLFIVYPFDSASMLQTHQFYSRSAWQVTQLVVL